NIGTTSFTFLLIGINIFLFMFLALRGGSMDVPNLINMCAKYSRDMIEGEWWRAYTTRFLHNGDLCVFINMFALYFLGVLLERIYVTKRFIVIYILSGIGGSLTSFAFSTSISAGASGALFGLFGALLFFGVIYKNLFFQTMGKNVIF